MPGVSVARGHGSRSLPLAPPRSPPVPAQRLVVTVPLRSLLESVPWVLLGAMVAPICVSDLLQRARAGPVRFRLPLASMAGAKADRAWRMTTRSWISLISCVLVVVGLSLGGDLPGALLLGMNMGAFFANGSRYVTRRDRSRWAGWVAAGWALAGGAVSLAFGVLTLTTGFATQKSILKSSGPGTLIVLGAVVGGWGVYQVVEMLRGTVLRERGVELFGVTRPWKRVAVEGWSPDEGGGFLLGLKLLSPRLFAHKVRGDMAVVVPVAAADRPDVESFLTGRGATTPVPTAVD